MKGAIDPRKRYPYVCEDERGLSADQQTVTWLTCRTAQEIDEERAVAASSVQVGRHNKVKVDMGAMSAQREARWTKHVHRIDRWRWQDGTVVDTLEDGVSLARVYREGDTDYLEEIDEAIRSLSVLEEGSKRDLDSSRPSSTSEATPSTGTTDGMSSTATIVSPPD